MYKYNNRYFKVIKVERHSLKQDKYLLKRYRKILFFYIKEGNSAFWVSEFEFKRFKKIK